MNQEIELLVFKAYHGKLSWENRILLTQWVAASPVNARQVIEYSVDANSIAVALQNSQDARTPRTHQLVKTGIEKKASAFGGFTSVNSRSIAAAILAAATLFALTLWLGWIQQLQESHEYAEIAKVKPVRCAMVQVMESTDLKWNQYTNHLEDSESIEIPASGFLYHEFRGGGFILLEGPTTYQLEDNFTIRLVKGRLVAKADPGEPFTILVDGNRIKAEEAEFGVQSNDDDVASAIVFEGSVEITQNLSEGQSPITRVKAGQIVMLPPSVGKAAQLARATQADSSEYERLIDSVKLRPSHMSSAVQFLADTPPSLLGGELADRKYARMFCERAGVSVKAEELPIIPNRLTDLGEVPADLLLDSYILHFDPQVYGSKAGSWMAGKVTFDRPIHGVLGSAHSIRSTDAFFASTNTVYPRTSGSAGSLEDAADWGIEYDSGCIKLEEDGKTLLFRVDANQEVDQIRILVEARKPTQLSE